MSQRSMPVHVRPSDRGQCDSTAQSSRTVLPRLTHPSKRLDSKQPQPKQRESHLGHGSTSTSSPNKQAATYRAATSVPHRSCFPMLWVRTMQPGKHC